MIPGRLLERFDLLGDTPETIEQLRKLIVVLAIAGKLGPDLQQPNTVSLLELHHEARRSLVKRGAAVKKESPEVSVSELPGKFLTPDHFVRLGFVARIEKGPTGIKSARRGDYPLVVTGSERSNCDHFDYEGAAAIVPLVSSAGHGKASLNRLHYQEGKFALGSILAAVFPHDPDLLSARFLFEYLSAFKEELLVSRMTGTANVTLTVSRIADVPVPLISLSAQRKIDELMALCDQWETARNRREEGRDRLVAASLNRINQQGPAADGGAATAFREHALFHLDHLPRLTTRPEHIKSLRQTILNLAVRGRLVPQDPSDEPASELLNRIAAEQEALIRRKELRKKYKVEPASTSNAAFQVPPSWIWCRLGNLFNLVTDGAHHTPQYINAGVPFLSVKDVSSGCISFEYARLISEKQHSDLCKRCRPERGDILLTKVGTTGIAVPVKTDREFSIFVSVALLKFSQQNLSQDYLCYLLNSPFVRQQSADNTQGIGNKNLVLRLINRFALPIPPLAEQHRIVAKVDELMAVCDQLEAQLTTTQTDSRRLLEAVLSEALAPAAERKLTA